jgi:hypothetical protein
MIRDIVMWPDYFLALRPIDPRQPRPQPAPQICRERITRRAGYFCGQTEKLFPDGMHALTPCRVPIPRGVTKPRPMLPERIDQVVSRHRGCTSVPAWQAGRADLIRSPRIVLSHVRAEVEEWSALHTANTTRAIQTRSGRFCLVRFVPRLRSFCAPGVRRSTLQTNPPLDRARLPDRAMAPLSRRSGRGPPLGARDWGWGPLLTGCRPAPPAPCPAR